MPVTEGDAGAERGSRRSVQDESDIKATCAGPRHVKGLRGECSGFWRTAKPRKSA